jgi:hypothetical protein
MDRRRSLVAVIGRHFASFRKSQRKTMAALAFGLLMASRLGLASLARGMADSTTPRHRIKRAARFVSNRGIRIEQASACLVDWLLGTGAQRPVVALDWTDLGSRRVMLSAAVAVGGRALPLAWTVMGRSQFTRKRKSRNDAEEQIIELLKGAFGECSWVLVADRGFARVELFRKLQDWGIRYVIRACGNPWVEAEGFCGRLWDIGRRAGQVRFWGQVLYHRVRRLPVNLVVAHAEPAPEPWYLVSNLKTAKAATEAYRRRAWIEEHFRDAKSQMGLDRLRIKSARRIERLLILMAIVMAVAILTALQWQHRHPGEDLQLTTHKRGRSLSLFRLGMHLAQHLGLPAALPRLSLTSHPQAL